MNSGRPATNSEWFPTQTEKPTDCSPEIFSAGRTLRVGVLSNPLSRGNRKGLDEVRAFLAGQPQAIHREVQTPADVASALVDFAHNSVDVVAVNGGDGTTQAVLTALFHRRPFGKLPLLAILRSGTDSSTARDVGLKGSRKRALQKLFTWAHTRTGDAAIVERPVLRVQGAVNQGPLYGMIFGAAGIYQGIRFTHSKVYTLGVYGSLAPGLTLARFLLALTRRKSDYVTPVPMTIALDRHPPVQVDCLLIIVSTLERLVFGLRPFWGTEKAPLHYTAISARPQYLFRALASLLRGRKGRHGTTENGYFSHNVHEVRLTFDSGFTLDGELYTPDARLGPVVVQDGGQASFLRL
ncbi:MAG: diacylglycerol kinase family protein [Syntrophobacterales bacterium]